MRKTDRRIGQITLMLALAGGLIFGMAGLGVDLLYMMAIRARLGIASDAAALGAARNLGRSSNLSSQQAEAEAMALNLFRSHFSDGHLLSQTSGYDSPLIEPGPTPGTRQVTVVGRATVPMFFMGFFGLGDVEISTRATAIRKDVNLVLVLDRSRSMFNSGAWPILQEVASDFVDEFDPTRDRMGLVVFGGEGRLDFAPGFSVRVPIKNLISQHIAGIWVRTSGRACHWRMNRWSTSTTTSR